MKTNAHSLPVAVIGAGPVGLAAAAHLLQRGLTPLILEAGQSIASNLESYRHVRLFSSWRYNLDRAATQLLRDEGWQKPPLDALPTAGDMIDQYLSPLSKTAGIAKALKLGHRVISISRLATDKVKTKGRDETPFVIRAITESDEVEILASAVIDTSGTWSQPNPMGANGLPALGELRFREFIDYGMPDVAGTARQKFEGKHVLVVGAGHSAAGSLLALADLAEQTPTTQISWAVRGEKLPRVFGGGEKDGLPARGQLGLRLKALHDDNRLRLYPAFKIHSVHQNGATLIVKARSSNGDESAIENVDRIIVATGARPNLDITRELRLKLDPWLESTELLAPLIDPNEHSCGTVRPHGHRELAHPEVGYYAAGARSYGRAPNFLLATGYEQVRSIAAALVGDFVAADDVQLELPETGVCSVSFSSTPAKEEEKMENTTATRSTEEELSTAGCCGGPAPQNSNACCVKDAEAKAVGKAGCGCSSTPMKPSKPATTSCV